jgi:hypothetical protein
LVFIPEGLHGQLTARLRALGVRPLMAEQMVAHSDACTLQDALAVAANTPANSVEQRIQVLMEALAGDSGAAPLSGLAPDDQLALVQSRAPSPMCREGLERARSPGGTLAEMLPYQGFTSDGELGGSVVYARDFGRNNELLRGKFANRAWFVARVTRTDTAVSVALEPYRPR